MALFDLPRKSFSKMAETRVPDKSWADPACPGPIGDALVSHGSSLAKRSNGVWELYVVNHGRRKSIEMYELKPASGSWALIWQGCVAGGHDYNDVAILPDGGFVGTYPTGLLSRGNTADQIGGGVMGYVALWISGKGESEVPGTRVAYPNGVVVSTDARDMFWNVFVAREVRKYDLNSAEVTGSVKVDFLPDNLTWTKGLLLEPA
jgi:DNA-binding beta-propeller fold protein YncE